MRTFVFVIASTIGSLTFQLSVLFWPQEFQRLAWAVKYLWVVTAILWIVWLLTHPAIRRFLGIGDSPTPPGPGSGSLPSISIAPVISPIISPTIAAVQTNTQEVRHIPPTEPRESKPELELSHFQIEDYFLNPTLETISKYSGHGYYIEVKAAIASFYYTPSQTAPRSIECKSQLTYFDAEGKFVKRVVDGVWLPGSPINYQRFEQADAHDLVLGLVKPNKLMTYKHGVGHTMDGPFLYPEADMLDGAKFSVHVNLVCLARGVLVSERSFTFKIILDENPQIIVESKSRAS